MHPFKKGRQALYGLLSLVSSLPHFDVPWYVGSIILYCLMAMGCSFHLICRTHLATNYLSIVPWICLFSVIMGWVLWDIEFSYIQWFAPQVTLSSLITGPTSHPMRRVKHLQNCNKKYCKKLRWDDYYEWDQGAMLGCCAGHHVILVIIVGIK